MSRKRANRNESESESETASGFVLFRRAVATLGVLLLIAYIASLVISRTDGFRYMVEERLKARWETDAHVERAWLGADLTLHVEGIYTEPFRSQGTGPGFSIQALQVRRHRLRGLWPGASRVRGGVVHGGTWSFQQDADGAWTPRAFFADAVWLAQLAGLRFLEDNVEADYLGDAGRDVSLHQVELLWWDAQAAPLASVRGLNFARAQTRLLERTFLYQRLTAASAQWGPHRLVDIDQARLWIDGREVPVPETGITAR